MLPLLTWVRITKTDLTVKCWMLLGVVAHACHSFSSEAGVR